MTRTRCLHLKNRTCIGMKEAKTSALLIVVNVKFITHSFLAGSAYRECMDNGTWALKSNYSSCEPILEEKVGVQPFFLFVPVLKRRDAKTNQRRESLRFP